MSSSYATCFLFPLALIALPLPAALRTQQVLSLPAVPGQQISNLTADAQDNLIFGGTVNTSYPAAQSYSFIRKLDPSGHEIFTLNFTKVFSIYLAVDNKGDIYAAGPCASSAPYSVLPTSSISSDTSGSCLLKLHGNDGSVAYEVFMPEVSPNAVTVNAAGQALVVGSAWAKFFQPTPGAFASTPGGNFTQFTCLLVISAAGDRLVWAASLGGKSVDCFSASSCFEADPLTQSVAVMPDAQGNIWLTGFTNTIDMPVTADAMQSKCGCSVSAGDIFLAKFSQDGTRLLYSTYLGSTPLGGVLGSGGSDAATAAAMDAAGHIWVAGGTTGVNFPVTSNAAQPQPVFPANGEGAFLTEYDPASNRLLYSTYFGSASASGPSASIYPTSLPVLTHLTVASNGTVFVAGTFFANLPGTISGFTRGAEFLASIDPATYATSSTFFPSGATGAGLFIANDGSAAVAGHGNIVEFVSSANPLSPEISAVANSGALELSSQVSPGELISIYGSNLGPASPLAADLSQGQAPLHLGGVQVLINGAPVPLLYAQGDQINAIVPFAISPGGTATIIVDNTGVSSNPAQLNTAVAAPSAFLLNESGWAAAFNQDGTVNSANNRAKLGSTVTVFATGFGQLNPPPHDGSAVTTPLPALFQPVQVYYQGQPVNTSAEPVPGIVAGVMQVTFSLPTSATTSELPFQLIAGGWPAQDYFFVLVKE